MQKYNKILKKRTLFFEKNDKKTEKRAEQWVLPVYDEKLFAS